MGQKGENVGRRGQMASGIARAQGQKQREKRDVAPCRVRRRVGGSSEFQLRVAPRLGRCCTPTTLAAH